VLVGLDVREPDVVDSEELLELVPVEGLVEWLEALSDTGVIGLDGS